MESRPDAGHREKGWWPAGCVFWRVYCSSVDVAEGLCVTSRFWVAEEGLLVLVQRANEGGTLESSSLSNHHLRLQRLAERMVDSWVGVGARG